MDYKLLYFKLLKERCQEEKGELHHIVPRHSGGTDQDGLVRLSRRNHTLAHYIRWRWLRQSGDLLAYRLMLGLPENAMNIPEYKEKHRRSVQKTLIWRERIGLVRRGKTYEDLYGDCAAIQKEKRASKGEQNGMYGKHHSAESIEKIKQSRSTERIRLTDPSGESKIFLSKQALIDFGMHRDVIFNNIDKRLVIRGKYKNYKIETVWD